MCEVKGAHIKGSNLIFWKILAVSVYISTVVLLKYPHQPALRLRAHVREVEPDQN